MIKTRLIVLLTFSLGILSMTSLSLGNGSAPNWRFVVEWGTPIGDCNNETLIGSTTGGFTGWIVPGGECEGSGPCDWNYYGSKTVVFSRTLVAGEKYDWIRGYQVVANPQPVPECEGGECERTVVPFTGVDYHDGPEVPCGTPGEGGQ